MTTEWTRSALPPDHPQRIRLNDEVHARPPERIFPPARVSFIAVLADEAERAASWRTIAEVAMRAGAPPPSPDAPHYSQEIDGYRLKAERHTEFLRLKIIAPGFGRGGAEQPFLESAIESAGADWLASLQGQTLSAIHVAVAPATVWPPKAELIGEWLGSRDTPVGAMVSDRRGAAFTDFLIGADGFSRLLIIDNGMTPGQAGRNLQRLVEIEAYRMLALLAFPLARARMGELNKLESELRDATTALVRAAEAEEAHLLERLTHLAAAIENLQSASQFRFAAAASYHELVERRIDELREDRLEGLQTFSEFFDRRLQPAMRTCRVVVERQADLSARVARTTELLSTRVEISSQRQSHALLDSMDRRAQLQLRLQETVEGLSVAAITYYIVSLVGKGAEALGAAGLKVDPAISMGVAIPIVALIVAIGVARIRRSVAKTFDKH